MTDNLWELPSSFLLSSPDSLSAGPFCSGSKWKRGDNTMSLVLWEQKTRMPGGAGGKVSQAEQLQLSHKTMYVLKMIHIDEYYGI